MAIECVRFAFRISNGFFGEVIRHGVTSGRSLHSEKRKWTVWLDRSFFCWAIGLNLDILRTKSLQLPLFLFSVSHAKSATIPMCRVHCAPRVGKKKRNQSMKQPWTGWLMSERRMKKYNNFALPSRFDVVVVVVDAIIFRILRTKLFIFLKLFFVWFARIYLFWHFLFRDQARRFIRSCGSVFDVRTLLRFTRSKN